MAEHHDSPNLILEILHNAPQNYRVICSLRNVLAIFVLVFCHPTDAVNKIDELIFLWIWVEEQLFVTEWAAQPGGWVFDSEFLGHFFIPILWSAQFGVGDTFSIKNHNSNSNIFLELRILDGCLGALNDCWESIGLNDEAINFDDQDDFDDICPFFHEYFILHHEIHNSLSRNFSTI